MPENNVRRFKIVETTGSRWKQSVKGMYISTHVCRTGSVFLLFHIHIIDYTLYTYSSAIGGS
jgi:hypothetical protein